MRNRDSGLGTREMPERASRSSMPRTRSSRKASQLSFARPFQSRSILAATLLAIIATSSAAVGPNVRAVQPDQLTNYWVMTNTSLNVDVPNSGVNLSKPTCSAVTYMIGSDGATHDIVVRETIPAGDLKSVAASAVKDMHYVPGANNAAREPVFTYIIIPFNLPKDPAERKKITDACTLKDFPQGYR